MLERRQANPENSEIIKIDQLRQAAREYCLFHYPPRVENRVTRDSPNYPKYVTLQENLTLAKQGLSEQVIERIVDEEKRAVLHIPESLFLSEETFERLKDKWSSYKFELASFIGYRKGLDELLKPFFKSVDYGDYLNGCRFIYALEENQVIAALAYETTEEDDENGKRYHVVFSAAAPNSPGAGLAVLDKLVKEACRYRVSQINLTTLHIPRGLGNLGFEYIPSKGTYRPELTAEYRADFEK